MKKLQIQKTTSANRRKRVKLAIKKFDTRIAELESDVQYLRDARQFLIEAFL